MLRRFLIIISFCPMLLAAASLPPLEGEDQFGRACTIKGDTRLLLFSHDKSGSHLAMEVVEQLWPRGDAPMQLVVGTRDVPGWVMSWFMLPKLRRQTTPLCLDEQGLLARVLAPNEGEVLLIHLDQLEVEQRRGFLDRRTLVDALKRNSSP